MVSLTTRSSDHTDWNVLYDDILVLNLGEGVELVAYADDLAVIVTARTGEEVTSRANLVLERIRVEMEQLGLQIVPEKTEAVLLCTRRNTQTLRLRVADTDFETSPHLKYLGVWIDTNMRGVVHLRKTVEKAEKISLKLSRLMPNVRGPGAGKRKILASVVQSVVLYAAPAWEEVLRHKKYKGMLDRCLRRATLRVCSAYRTCSNAAAQVISGIPPAHLLVAERSRGYHTGDKDEAKTWMEDKWQEEWEANTETAQWTKRLIPDVRRWKNRTFGEVNFHLTQFLTGHGVFGSYLHRFRLYDSDICWFCDKADSPEHTMFECDRWEDERRRLSACLGADLTADNFCPMMLASKENWGTVTAFATTIMKSKEQHQRDMGR